MSNQLSRHRRAAIIAAVAVVVIVAVSLIVAAIAKAGASGHSDASSGWYDTTYGTFAPTTVTGSGDQIVSLPARGGRVTFSTASAHYEVEQLLTIDGKYVEGADLYDDEFGPSTQGEPTVWNLSSPRSDAMKLDVTASGPWTLALAPMASAPVLPTSGSGSGVYRFDGAAGSWTASVTGPPDFSGTLSIRQSNTYLILGTDQILGLGGDSADGAVAPRASRKGVQHAAGPSIVVIQANGAWTLE